MRSPMQDPFAGLSFDPAHYLSRCKQIYLEKFRDI